MHQASMVMAAAAVMFLVQGNVMNAGCSRAQRWQAPQCSGSSLDNLTTQR